jgi:hypothetical protein
MRCPAALRSRGLSGRPSNTWPETLPKSKHDLVGICLWVAQRFQRCVGAIHITAALATAGLRPKRANLSGMAGALTLPASFWAVTSESPTIRELDGLLYTSSFSTRNPSAELRLRDGGIRR